MNIFGLCVLGMLGVLAALDIWLMYRGREFTNRYFFGWMIVLGILLTFLAIGLSGCASKHHDDVRKPLIIYPVKGCDYWPNIWHYGNTFYREGPVLEAMVPYVARCYPDKRKVVRQ